MHDRSSTLKVKTKQLALWTFLWLISLAAATFGKALLWESSSPAVVGLVTLNIVIGLLMLKANASYMNALDELETKMHMKAMGLSLGLGLVVAVTLSFISDWGLLPPQAHISVLMVFMSLTYIIGLMLEKRRYS